MADIKMGKSAELGGTIGVLSGVATENELGPHADHVIPSVSAVLPIVLAKKKKEKAELWWKEAEKSGAVSAKKYQDYLEDKGGPGNSESELVKELLTHQKNSWFEENPARGFRKPNLSETRKSFHTDCTAKSENTSSTSKSKEFSSKVKLRRYFAGLPPWKEEKPTHIVVGAGSAGCVLANRLSEDPENRVLLMEAGPKDDWWRWTIHMPAALMYNVGGKSYNWYYHTLAQPHMNERCMYWPRGRVWGGSSSINAMVYIRGHPYDYDRWEREGASNWAYKYCLPYFKKAENYALGGDDYRGGDGPLQVSLGACKNPLYMAFVEAGKQAGFGYTSDMNGFRQEGVGPLDMTIYRGKRWSTSRAYLWPVLEKRKNLRIESNVLVTRVVMDGYRAVGVEFTRKPKDSVSSRNLEKVYCEADVILCGGAVNTPQLLMLSGIGPGDHLFHHNIPRLIDLPGIGKNLQDHLEVYVQRACKLPITLYSKTTWLFPHNMVRIGLEWLLKQTGDGATSHLEAGGFVRSRKDVQHPDIQLHFLPATVHDHGRKMGRQHAFQVHVGPMRPKSRGWIKLRGASPLIDPMIQPMYLSEESDLKEFHDCVRVAREIFSQPAFDEFRGEEIGPGHGIDFDSSLEQFVRNHADSAYHPCGTCKMGRSDDGLAVVNPRTMGVYGVEHLKVVDASVMPSIVSGNLNAPVIMMAEKAADIIRGKTPLLPVSVPLWVPEQ